MKVKAQKDKDELCREYDFDYSKAVRGKYHKQLLEEGANIVVLESDVADDDKDGQRTFSKSPAIEYRINKGNMNAKPVIPCLTRNPVFRFPLSRE